jgi:hypothetical protein
MIDLVDRVAALLKAEGYEGVTTHLLDSTTGREAIVVRRLPYVKSVTYMDGSEAIDYLYQVVVRRRQEEHAMSLCSDIAELLDGRRIDSENKSYTFTSSEIYTSPQGLKLDEKLFYAWEVRIRTLIET